MNPGPVHNAIRFVLDGEVREAHGVDPNTTLLDYLREDLHRTGTKEGCAEGDCGACTVAVADRHEGRLQLRAVNACIKLLPTLDGKALFTVESLRSPSGALHPVQRALVESHGSQCGFCTPGFVMSMFALYKSEHRPSRRRVADVLAGNLCRCTGYRPIFAAAERMYETPGDGSWLHAPCPENGAPPAADERQLVARLEELERRDTLSLTGPARGGGERRYFAPVTLDALAELFERHPRAHLLAGGTDVGLWITKAHRDLDTVIYLGEVEELRRVHADDGGLEIGAAVTLTDADAAIGERFPNRFADLHELFRRFGSPPIRNAATLVGNIANGSPIGDSMPALICLEATLRLRRGRRRRELPLEELYLGYRQTALEPGELIESVHIPAAAADRRLRAYKISKRFDQDISGVCGAFSLRLEGGRARDVRVCFGGMAATPRRAGGCEAALEGRRWDESALPEALAALDDDYAPIDDLRASAGYRRTVARNLLRKFVLETSGFEGPIRVAGAEV